MDSLVGYGSDDEVESDRYVQQPSVSFPFHETKLDLFICT